jgi:hypothetical protein
MVGDSLWKLLRWLPSTLYTAPTEPISTLESYDFSLGSHLSMEVVLDSWGRQWESFREIKLLSSTLPTALTGPVASLESYDSSWGGDLPVEVEVDRWRHGGATSGSFSEKSNDCQVHFKTAPMGTVAPVESQEFSYGGHGSVGAVMKWLDTVSPGSVMTALPTPELFPPSEDTQWSIVNTVMTVLLSIRMVVDGVRRSA